MTRPNDIDFRFQLWPHGWASAGIWVDGDPIEFRLTYVWNDPLESLAKSALRLAAGEKTATVEWSDEPGTYILKFEQLEAEHHLLCVKLSEYSKELPVYTPNDFVGTTIFFVARDFWLNLVQHELSKIAMAFKYKHYREKRDECFPRDLIRELQLRIRQRDNEHD